MKKAFLYLVFALFASSTYAQLRSTQAPGHSISQSSNNVSLAHRAGAFINEVPDMSQLSTPMGGCPSVLLFEDFQSDVIPAGWINLDLDGLTDANGRPANWFTSVEFQSTLPGDTNWVAQSSSWFSPFGVANNWLILDAVTICDPTMVLKWESAPFEGPTYMDGYKVLLSPTGGSNPSDFTVELADFAEGIGGTANLTAGIAHTSFNGNNGLLQAWSVALGSYVGQNIRIAFRHESDDDNLISIDNIYIGLDNAYDLEASNAYTGEYPLTPVSQVRPIVPTGDVTNMSTSPVSSCSLFFEIFDAGFQSVFTQNETAGSLNGGQTQPFISSTWFTPPPVVQDYELSIRASGQPADPDISNNTDTQAFAVTDSVFSRERGNITNALSIGSGVEGKLCNKFELVYDDYVSSLSAYRTAPVVGDTMTAEIFVMTGNVPGSLVASSLVTYAASADPDLYTYPLENGPVFLTAGTYLACINEGEPSAATIGTTEDEFVPEGSWVFFNSQWNAVEFFNFNVAFVIRMNMAGCAAEAGTLTADASPVCMSNGSADISATENAAPVVPAGYQVGYVLTSNPGLIIEAVNATPEFNVIAAGDYTIHTLVYDPATLDLSGVVFGTTAAADVLALIQANNICAALDVAGAPITVNEEPTATISGGGVACDGGLVQLDVALTGSGPWDFSILLDGSNPIPLTNITDNPFTLFTEFEGTYTVSAVSDASCPGVGLGSAVVVEEVTPVAGFTWTQVPGSLEVIFTDTSTGNPTGWSWDFNGDATEDATTQNGSFTFSATGSSLGVLTASNSCGSDQVLVPLTITPANDLCSGAQTVACGDVVAGSTVDGTEQVIDGSAGIGVWYVFTGTGDEVTFTTCDDADFDTEITVMTSPDCSVFDQVAQNDDDFNCTGNTSTATFTSTLNETYYVYVSYYLSGSTATGTFNLTVSCTAPPVAPDNDDVCQPEPIALGANGPYSNELATAEVWETDLPSAGCSEQGGWCVDLNVENSTWFTFVAPPSGQVTIDTEGSDYDTQLAVYEAVSCQDLISGSATLVGANDDAGTGLLSLVLLCDLTPGETYFVLLDGYGGAEGNGFLNLTETTLDADFTYAATGLSVEFTDASVTSTSITEWAWDFDDGGATSSDASPTHVFSADGPYTVCLTVTDENGCTNEYCEAIQVTDIPTTIAEAVERGMELYPNPSNGQFVVEVSGVEADIQIIVSDVAGRQVYNEGVVLNNDFRKELNLNVASGTYLLQIVTLEGSVTRKIQIN